MVRSCGSCEGRSSLGVGAGHRGGETHGGWGREEEPVRDGGMYPSHLEDSSKHNCSRTTVRFSRFGIGLRVNISSRFLGDDAACPAF